MRLHEIADDTLPEEQPEELTSAYKDTAEIKASAWTALQAKIAKVNRKAARLKVPEVKISIEREFYVPAKEVKKKVDPATGHWEKEIDVEALPEHLKEKYYEVKVEGDAPQVAGYKFMATIEHKGEAGNIIRCVPGEENNENIRQFYEARPDYCDHCHKKRHRIDTFIVKSLKDGQLRQIGRNCLADFLGGMDPKRILWYFSLRDVLERAVEEASEEDERSGRRREYGATPSTVLAIASRVISEFGYRKAGPKVDAWGVEQDGPRPTSDMVRFAIFGRPYSKMSEEDRRLLEISKAQSTPEQEKLVSDAVEWFKSIPQEEKDRTDFYHNIDVLLRSEVITRRDVGILGAIFPAYYRHLHAAEEKKAQAHKKNEHVGVVGEKLPPTEVTVTRTQLVQTDFGTSQMCFMEDAEGHIFMWFNSSQHRLEEGKKMTIVATIKKHGEYKGRMQTVLTRVKEYQAKPEKAPKAAKPTPAPVEPGQPAPEPTRRAPRPEGGQSKVAMATTKFQEFQQANGRAPSVGEFKAMLSQDPFNMSPVAAQTYYYGIKKKIGGVTESFDNETQFSLLKQLM